MNEDDKILESEDTSTIDDKEKLGAFAIKNLLLYWKRVMVIVGIIGGVILLMSGYSCSYKGFSCNKTAVSIHDKTNQ